MGRSRFVVVFLIACGGGGSSNDTPDAASDVDVFVQLDAPVVPGCGYSESADATNNTSPTAEATGVAFTTASSICGTVNNGHFTSGAIVDIDTYKFSVTADSDLLVHLTGTGLETLGRVVIQVGSTAGMQRNLGIFEGDHGTVSVRLPVGEYVVAVTGLSGADIAAGVPYRLALVADAPAARCAKVTAAATFTEANDGAGNIGNDMITIDEAANPTTKLTVSTADNPEPTGLTTAAGMKYRLAGSSGNVDPADDYEDRDTFAFTTGATTNQLSVRINWASTAADFDFKVFPVANVLSVTGGLASSLVEDEFQTFAVKPNTTYWLWIGAYDGATGQPTLYDATLCADAFTP